MAIINISTLIFFLLLSIKLSCSTRNHSILIQGSSMSVDEPNDVIVSPKGTFSAGFYAIGENAYCFGVWFSRNPTLVWMANRDDPVNGKKSKLSLLANGNLVLVDADNSHVWSTDTVSSPSSTVHLVLYDTGNLVLTEEDGDGNNNNMNSTVLWQSFDFPTDTLLPEQVFARFTKVISSKSQTNKSTGLYTLFFDNDNVLRLVYNGPEVSGIYWPDPWNLNWANFRSSYNSSRVAVLDTLGTFISSDNFTFTTSDHGSVIQRRLTLDPNGNLRVYSRSSDQDDWYVSWQAYARPCRIHGVCGPNSLCTYHTDSAIKCSCLPGHKMKYSNDWSYGCEPRFSVSCKNNESGSSSQFLSISNVELYGYDYGLMTNYTLDQCKEFCLQLCDCKGVQYTYNKASGTNNCYVKVQLRNAYRIPYFNAEFLLKLPVNSTYSFQDDQVSIVDRHNNLDCPVGAETIQLERIYIKGQVSRYVKFLLWFAGGVGIFEMLCIFVVWYFLVRFRVHSGADERVYDLGFAGFRRFSYSELKQATKGFSQEIGKGAWGIVYKGVLSDGRVVAVKRLMEANQGEEEFLAEVSSIGRLNHMNLIEMWGYCAEGKHRLLVYEHMEHGSLAQNLRTNRLDWSKRFEIALGTAKGLSYLHDECLDWILHCDVKPQNILLDSNFQPKVADFGLSKLLKRSDTNKYSSFSKIRGTRGYMAPEWVLNLPITSKVDVYSYGIVVLEMFTGKSATKNLGISSDGVENNQHMYLVAWLREKQNMGFRCGWVSEILDPTIEGDYDENKLEALARVALQCVEDERDKRPTMSQVVEMLQKYL
ncbi:hypothetical protein HN51_053072 [Arachis hypogaea]|uniref:putative receptor protein kinase ZmPK1 isoform X1 n=2 Tax=Arachis ipaensis TaxID=130454 RepID=UPI0007AF666E|nr:putative receptor protein kinase ZmPK1 isoform X1 [Arachis ipaensis]XP_025668641.1 putative receptor protein kinase ZmPK1 [Arachis hypogaea]QHN94503.1 Putative receptor protein kinase [Arachis hypogaea]